MHNPDKIITAIKNGKEKEALTKVYHFYRRKFINYAKKNYSDLRNESDVIISIYGAMIIALGDSIQSGRLTDLQNGSLETYLFTIGNNLINTHFNQEKRRKNRFSDTPIDNYYRLVDSSDDIEEDLLKHRQFFREKIFPQLGKKCQQLLELFYYRGYLGEEIAVEMDFNSANAAIVQKGRCIKKLKQFKTAIIKQLNA